MPETIEQLDKLMSDAAKALEIAGDETIDRAMTLIDIVDRNKYRSTLPQSLVAAIDLLSESIDEYNVASTREELAQRTYCDAVEASE